LPTAIDLPAWPFFPNGPGVKVHQEIYGEEGFTMLWKADPTFYPSPKLAAQAPHEKPAYVVAFNRGAMANRTR
jgi:hypothetical protein